MNCERPFRRGPSRLSTFGVCAAMCVWLQLLPAPVHAQDIGEAARLERARKAAPSKKQQHIYTNEDLRRRQILTPEDRAPVEARKQNTDPPVLAETPAVNSVPPVSAAAESLGEIARRLRRAKVDRQIAEARKVPPPQMFRLELPAPPVFGSAKPLRTTSPRVGLSSPFRAMRDATSAPVDPAVPTTWPRGITKRDPFSGRLVPLPRPAAPSNLSAPRSVAVPTSAPAAVPAPGVSPIAAPARLAIPTVVGPAATKPVPTEQKAHLPVIRVQSGDTLWFLSKQFLGRASRWQEWLRCNPQLHDPRRMRAGENLLVPGVSMLRDPAGNSHTAQTGESRAATLGKPPAPSRAGTHLDPRAGPTPGGQPPGVLSVRPGDSLWKLAYRHFGRGADWPCIARANPQVKDASIIFPGHRLQLPSGCGGSAPSFTAAVPLPTLPN